MSNFIIVCQICFGASGSTSGFKPFDHKFMRAYVRCAKGSREGVNTSSTQRFPENVLLNVMEHCTWMCMVLRNKSLFFPKLIHIYYNISIYLSIDVITYSLVCTLYMNSPFPLRLDNWPCTEIQAQPGWSTTSRVGKLEASSRCWTMPCEATWQRPMLPCAPRTKWWRCGPEVGLP